MRREFTRKSKSISVKNPPYNTRSAFDHYDDGIEHSLWLSLMRDRLKYVQQAFMRIGGSIGVFFDDNEVHYLKVMMDELFGQASFIASIAWRSGNITTMTRNDYRSIATQFRVLQGTSVV